MKGVITDGMHAKKRTYRGQGRLPGRSWQILHLIVVLDRERGGRTACWDGKAPISTPGLSQASSSPGPYHLLELLDPSLEGWRSRRGSESGWA